MERHKMRGGRRLSDLMEMIHLSPFTVFIQLRITIHELRGFFTFYDIIWRGRREPHLFYSPFSGERRRLHGLLLVEGAT